MSQETSITFFQVSPPADPRRCLEEVLKSVQATNVLLYRYAGPDTSWEDWFDLEQEGYGYEILGKRVSIDEAIQEYIPGKKLSLHVSSPMTKVIMMAVDSDIPEAVRGNHWPHNLVINFDSNDIIETAEETNGRLIARAFLSVTFSGYNVPRDLDEYRRQVLAMPLLREIQEQLSAAAGLPLECSIYSFI